jgi:hypothetical protein
VVFAEVVMTYIETDRYIYYAVKKYFAQNIIDSLPNDQKVWQSEFRKWLRDQGCEIVDTDKKTMMVSDGLGVIPGYDRLAFQNDADALVFRLRWS